jgi:CheY-like chemotaxis protein
VASTKTTVGLGESNASVNLTVSPSEVTPATNGDLDEGVPEVMDSLQHGRSAALLCVDRQESRDGLKTQLEEMGYVVDILATVDHALQRLRFNQYHVILLDDDLEARSLYPLAEYLASLNMSSRRVMFVVLIGERLKTADHLQAFVKSVDLVLHPDDLPQLVMHLTRSLRNHERYYKVFNECLIEAGKKL